MNFLQCTINSTFDDRHDRWSRGRFFFVGRTKRTVQRIWRFKKKIFGDICFNKGKHVILVSDVNEFKQKVYIHYFDRSTNFGYSFSLKALRFSLFPPRDGMSKVWQRKNTTTTHDGLADQPISLWVQNCHGLCGKRKG